MNQRVECCFKFLLKTLPLRFCAAALLLSPQAGAQAGVLQDHPGYWLGMLTLPNGKQLRIGIDIYTRADGSAWASCDSPDQGKYRIYAVDTHDEGDGAEVALSFARIKLTWFQDHFKAEFRQGRFTAPMELVSAARVAQDVRPQTPRAPLPYREETLAIRSVGGVTLGTTLSLPNGVAHPSLVILVHGSGEQDRDDEMLGHRPFAVLSDHLVRQGIAVLRYDKRGIGRSTGDFQNHTQAQLVDDLNAVLDAALARQQFSRVGLIGHSEGSMIAAATAAQRPESVAFVVSMAGPGVPGKDLLAAQDRLDALDKGASPSELERLMVYKRAQFDMMIAQPEATARVAALAVLEGALSPDDRQLVKKFAFDQGLTSRKEAALPSSRGLVMIDPQSDWRKVRCPVLVLNGSLDHQVPPDSAAAIAATMRDAGNPRVEVVILPSMNHLFQTATTGAVEEYAAIQETMAPAAMRQIADFIVKQR